VNFVHCISAVAARTVKMKGGGGGRCRGEGKAIKGCTKANGRRGKASREDLTKRAPADPHQRLTVFLLKSVRRSPFTAVSTDKNVVADNCSL
jgi:hypothetical protein